MKQSPQFCLFAARIVNTRRLPNKAKAAASFIPDPVLFYYRHRGAFFSCSQVCGLYNFVPSSIFYLSKI
jgi:hypothetical protein